MKAKEKVFYASLTPAQKLEMATTVRDGRLRLAENLRVISHEAVNPTDAKLAQVAARIRKAKATGLISRVEESYFRWESEVEGLEAIRRGELMAKAQEFEAENKKWEKQLSQARRLMEKGLIDEGEVDSWEKDYQQRIEDSVKDQDLQKGFQYLESERAPKETESAPQIVAKSADEIKNGPIHHSTPLLVDVAAKNDQPTSLDSTDLDLKGLTDWMANLMNEPEVNSSSAETPDPNPQAVSSEDQKFRILKQRDPLIESKVLELIDNNLQYNEFQQPASPGSVVRIHQSLYQSRIDLMLENGYLPIEMQGGNKFALDLVGIVTALYINQNQKRSLQPKDWRKVQDYVQMMVDDRSQIK